MKNKGNFVSPEFWCNKRVLITGHTGFKGSWLSLWLLNLGANVYGISLEPTTEESIFKKGNLAKSMNSIIQNIKNYELLYSTISKIKPDIIFHMAAQSLVRLSYESPIDTYATNVMGTINLLEVVRKLYITKLVLNVTFEDHSLVAPTPHALLNQT
jgi:CDP-glucose 4,6-dehydratase